MAKRSKTDGPNKSELIRALLNEGITSPQIIVEQIKATGQDVSAALVSQVKVRWNKDKKSAKPEAAEPQARRKPSGAPSQNGDKLEAAIEFIRAAGGFQAAKDLLNQLETIKNL